MHTHTTVVQKMVHIQRQRILSTPGEVIIGVGQDVFPVQVVARTPKETDFHLIDAADQLRISPDELEQYIIVEPGAAIEEGEELVRKKRFPRSKTVTAPVGGTYVGVRNGNLILRLAPNWVELRALVAGSVVSVVMERGVVLEINGSLIQAAWSSGKESFGTLKLITRTTDGPLTPDLLSPEVSGYILVAGKLTDADVLEQADSNEVRGIIAGSMPAHLIEAAQSVSYPILLTDGIGDFRMAAPIFQMFLQSEEKEVTLFGKRHGHSEDIDWRPEIIIPQDGSASSSTDELYTPLYVGQKVRILREPYANKVGEVTKLYARRQVAGVMKAHGADVTLSEGKTIFVPYANLDALI